MNEIIHPKWDKTGEFGVISSVTHGEDMNFDDKSAPCTIGMKVSAKLANETVSVALEIIELLSPSEYVAKILYFREHNESFENLSADQLVRINRDEIDWITK